MYIHRRSAYTVTYITTVYNMFKDMQSSYKLVPRCKIKLEIMIVQSSQHFVAPFGLNHGTYILSGESEIRANV